MTITPIYDNLNQNTIISQSIQHKRKHVLRKYKLYNLRIKQVLVKIKCLRSTKPWKLLSLRNLNLSWPTVDEGDLKAPFSIATTPRCRGGCYSFPWIAPLNLDPYLIILSVKQRGIKYHFLNPWYDLTWD